MATNYSYNEGLASVVEEDINPRISSEVWKRLHHDELPPLFITSYTERYDFIDTESCI